jgi:HD-like signal output (HDOD) protein
VEFRSLEIKISRSENLPVLPQIASSVIRLADDPDASARDMEILIERDSAIAAKVLRVANSSYYGLSQVPSIKRAISILGMNTVRSLVLGIAYRQIVSARSTSKCFSKVDFWSHSVAVATAAKILAKMKVPGRAEEVYSAGLMHNLGLLVMDRFIPDELDQSICYAQENNVPLHIAERVINDYDHPMIGGLLADRWGLKGSFKSAILYHHNPLEDTENKQITTIVAVADILAHHAGFHNNTPNLVLTIEPEFLDVIGVPAEQLDPIKAVIIAEVEKVQDALQIRAAA